MSYGRPITDPELLSKLNSDSNQNDKKYGPPIIDPNILAQLNSDSFSQQENKPVSIFQFEKNPRAFEQTKRELSTPSGFAKGTMGALGALGSVAQPELSAGPLLNALARIGMGTASTTAMDYSQPQNELSNIPGLATKNLGLNTLLEAVPTTLKAGLKAGKYLSEPFRQQSFSEQILNDIGGGKSLEENAKMFAQKLKNVYKISKTSGQELYDNIFTAPSVAERRIPLKNSNYGKLDEKISKKYPLDLRDLHNEYIQNPSLDNAHELQSQLGFQIRRLKNTDFKRGLSPAEDNVYQGYQRAQKLLKNDIHSELKNIDPNLSKSYTKANDHWINNVIPFEENAKISPIVKKDLKKLKGKELTNISEGFKNPNEEMLKIISDIGPEGANHILYDKLGKLKGKVKPAKLYSEYQKLKNEGFENYISSNLEDKFSNLEDKMTKRDLLARGLGGALGFSLGSSGAEKAAAAAAGMAMSPTILNKLQKYIPEGKSINALMDILSRSYRPIGRGLMVNNLNSEDK